ncbi:MAG: hypothetical protein NVSMB2_10700 [Chloroflexota bacterium]
MDENSRKYITKYVEDLHSLVSHGLQPVGHQVESAAKRNHLDAANLIAQLQTTLQEHERVLQDRMKALGTSPTTAIQDAAASVTGFVAGLYNQVRTEAVSKSLRDDYTFVSHCSISWMMLMTTARALGDHDTEEMAERGYRDTARLVMQIDRVMPSLVCEELKQDGFAAQDVSQWAHDFITKAWERSTLAGSGR